MSQIDATVAKKAEELEIVNLMELANGLEDLLPTGSNERLPFLAKVRAFDSSSALISHSLAAAEAVRAV